MGLSVPIPNPLDYVPNPIDLAKDAADKAEDFGTFVGNTTETVVVTGVDALQFQAGVTRFGLEKAWDAVKLGGTVADIIFDAATHPGDSNPPAAQGLEFAETKGASDLAYNADLGEIYDFQNGAQWEVVDVQDDSQTGFRAVALKPTDPNDDRVIVAYAGSGALNDWDDNFIQGTGLPSDQYGQAVDFANKWKTAAGAKNVILTGHSLGGGLASYASIKTDLPATAINSSPLALNHLGIDPRAAFDITQYYVPGEVLSGVNRLNPGDVRPGVNIAVQGENSIINPLSVGTNHALDSVAPDIPSPVKVE